MIRPRAYLALPLATLALLACAPTLAFGATRADVAAHQQAADAARAKASQQQALAEKLSAEADKLDGQVQSLQTQADALDPQISSASKRSRAIQAQVQSLHAELSVQTAEIATTQAQFAQEQGLLGRRAAASYKQGDWYYLDLLFGATDVRDFIARTELLGRLLRANSDAAAELRTTANALQKQKAAIGHTLADLSAKQAEALGVENGLKRIQDARQGKVEEQQALLDQKSSLLAETRANARKLLAIASAEQAASARIASELSAHRGSGAFHGSMTWPVPGFTQITSPFGWRVHPILKKRIFHAGIDISGAGINGHAIVAAAAGKVIAAGPRGGYGNVVMIDHGNGVVTVYAHQLSGGIRVSVGQRVRRGQRIGTVGSTGMSTGPHCHFEVRVNGSPVNPLNYV